jgi:hypothetical protein
VNFLQIVEGPQSAVAALIARIRVDHRHYGVSVVADHPTPVRAFPLQPLKLVAGRAADPVGRALTQAMERAGPMAAEFLRTGSAIEGIPQADRADPVLMLRWRAKAPWIDQVVDHLERAPAI